MIFVFGSNELGIHGRGAAKAALDLHGAVMHQGFGPQGNSFAIATCSQPAYGNHAITEEKLNFYIECFLYYASIYKHERFQVTRIGCGLAGWSDYIVAPKFKVAPANCLFDTRWMEYIGEDHGYWGTY